jgi:hypothetical protein
MYYFYRYTEFTVRRYTKYKCQIKSTYMHWLFSVQPYTEVENCIQIVLWKSCPDIKSPYFKKVEGSFHIDYFYIVKD